MKNKEKLGGALCLAVGCVMLAGTLFAAVACMKTDDEHATGAKYSVTYAAGAADATGSAEVKSYEEGDIITLLGEDTFAREDYVFTQWSDGEALYDAGATFTMPAHDVVFTAQWEAVEYEPLPDGVETVESIPAGSLVTTNGNAKANWFASYTDDGLKITAWVEDPNVYTGGNIYTNDGVEVVFAKVVRASSTEKIISVSVSAKGQTRIVDMLTGDAVEVEGVEANATLLTINEKTLAGYRVEITMPYAAADISKDAKDAAVALGLTNASNAANANSVYETGFDTDVSRVNTYIAVKNDDTFEANPYVELGSFWGNGTKTMKDVWNVDNDDGTAESYIYMTNSDGDNEIYMRKSSAYTEYYAEVQIHAGELRNGEQYPKFGLTVTTGSGKGFFFYVDAIATNGNPFNADSVNVGYAVNPDRWEGYTTVGNLGAGATADDYSGEGKYVTLGIYRRGGSFQLYVNGNAITEKRAIISFDEFYEEAYVGIASFNTLLTVKGYKLQTEDLEGYRQTLEDTLNAVPPVEEQPGKDIDASLADWSETDKFNPVTIPASRGRGVTIYATKDEKGVYVFYDAWHDTYTTGATDWWLNTNFEFRLGSGVTQYYASVNGHANGMDEVKFTSEKVGDLYHTQAEVFISYPTLAANGDGTYSFNSAYIPAGFAWKTVGEEGFVWDWETNGDRAFWLVPEADPNMRNFYITNNGFRTGSEKTIDGVEDAAWADVRETSLVTKSADIVAKAKAYLGDDGLYLLVTIKAPNINVETEVSSTYGEWWRNTNLEIFGTNNIRYGRVMLYGGAIHRTGYITHAAYNYVNGADGDTLTFEVFIQSENLIGVSANTRSVEMDLGGQLYGDGISDTWQEYAHANNPFLQVRRANWQPDAPVITIEKGAANVTGDDPTVTPVWNDEEGTFSITLPSNPYSVDGHDFGGWLVSVNGGQEQSYEEGETIKVPEGANVTIKANWLEAGVEYVDVTFELGYEGGETPAKKQVAKNGTLDELPTVGRGGYQFVGWYFVNDDDGKTTSERQLTTATEITESVTVRAVWKNIIDGDIENWTDIQKTNPVEIPVTNGRSVTVYAYMDDFGVYVFFDAIHGQYKNDTDLWYTSTNAEIQLGDSGQLYVSARNGGETRLGNGGMGAIVATDKVGDLFHTYAEAFITYETIGGGFGKDSAFIPATFAWKTDGDNDTAWSNGDFWYVPEASPNYENDLKNILITRDGIMTGTLKTIDGDLSDWEGELANTGSNAGLSWKWGTIYKEEGLYVAIQLEADTFNIDATNRDADWWYNTNVEFNADGTKARIMTYGGKLYHTGFVTDAAMKYTQNGSSATLTFEIFVSSYTLPKLANSVSDSSTTITMGGQIYGPTSGGGWNWLFQNFTVQKS